MKLKMKEVVNVYKRLGYLIEEKKNFSGAVNLAMARNQLELEKEIELLAKSEQDVRDRYVKLNEVGNPETKEAAGQTVYVFETTENEKRFYEEMKELKETEIDIPFRTLKETEFFSENHVQPTAKDLIALAFMME